MYMCVCMYVCMYVYMYVHIYIYLSAAWKFVNPLELSIFLHKYDPKHLIFI